MTMSVAGHVRKAKENTGVRVRPAREEFARVPSENGEEVSASADPHGAPGRYIGRPLIEGPTKASSSTANPDLEYINLSLLFPFASSAFFSPTDNSP